jgi:Tfp pilus assembly protein PilO
MVSLGLFYTFINPQYQRTKVLAEDVDRHKEVLDDVSALERTRDELLVKYQAIPKEEVENLKKLLPDNVDTVKLAMDLDAIGSKYGISITELNVTTDKKDNSTSVISTSESPYDKVLVSFSVIATYPNFLQFIKDVESSLRIADVRSITFKSNDNGIYEFEIDIETYWLK